MEVENRSNSFEYAERSKAINGESKFIHSLVIRNLSELLQSSVVEFLPNKYNPLHSKSYAFTTMQASPSRKQNSNPLSGVCYEICSYEPNVN